MLIVCGVDDSGAARRAARTAANLSETLGARLVLVTVVSVSVPPSGAAEAYGQLEEKALETGKSLLQRIKQQEQLTEAEDAVEVGAPATALVGVAGARRADLLVVGTRGRSALKAAVLGSVSREVMENAPCPVVVVPLEPATRASQR